MRNKLVGIAVLMSLCLFQCNSDDTIPGFEMTYFREFEIFSGLNTFDTHVFHLPNFDAQYESFLNNNGMTREQVTQIVPKAFRVTNITGNITFEEENISHNFLSCLQKSH